MARGRNSFSIDLRLDTKELLAIARAGPRIARLAGAAALNRGIRTSRTVALRTAGKELRIPQKVIRGRTFIRKAKGRKLRASLVVYGKPINPTALSQTRQTAKGVRSAGGRFWPGAFVPSESKGKAVARALGAVGERNSAVFQRRGKRRLPLRSIKIPIFEEVRKGVKRGLVAGAAQVRRRLPQEIDFRLARAAKGGGR